MLKFANKLVYGRKPSLNNVCFHGESEDLSLQTASGFISIFFFWRVLFIRVIQFSNYYVKGQGLADAEEISQVLQQSLHILIFFKAFFTMFMQPSIIFPDLWHILSLIHI